MKKLLLISSILIINAISATPKALREGIINSNYEQVAKNITASLSPQEKKVLIALADDILKKKELDYYFLNYAGLNIYRTPKVIIPFVIGGMAGFALDTDKPKESDDIVQNVLTFVAGTVCFASFIAMWVAIVKITREYFDSQNDLEQARNIKYLLMTSF